MNLNLLIIHLKYYPIGLLSSHTQAVLKYRYIRPVMDNGNGVHTKSIYMYLLTELEGRTGKYLARGRGVRTER